MKELDPASATTAHEVHAEVPRKQEYKHLGQSRNVYRLKMYSMDQEGKVEEVLIQRMAYIGMNGKEVLKAKADLDPRKRYCYALNKKNALRKMSNQ